MNPSRQRFEGLQRTLIRAGIARKDAARLAQELADHREELVAELRGNGIGMTLADAERLAEQRLGSDQMLATAAISSYRSGTLMGRHPWLFFGVMPALLTPLAMFAVFVLMLLPLVPMGMLTDAGLAPRWSWLPSAICGVSNYALPGLMAMLAYRSAARRALSMRWRIAACAPVIAWGAWLYCSTFLRVETNRHAIMMGTGRTPSVAQGAGALAVVSIYGWLRDRRARRARLEGNPA
jgi:hypothetical protein